MADGSLDGATARTVLVEDLTSWGFNVGDEAQMSALMAQLGVN